MYSQKEVEDIIRMCFDWIRGQDSVPWEEDIDNEEEKVIRSLKESHDRQTTEEHS